MTSTYLTGSYPSGYTISGKYQTIMIGATGSIGGGGVTGGTNAAYTIVNLGTIDATNPSANGISLKDGGSVTNTSGERIEGGGGGVFMENAHGAVLNDGTIIGSARPGVELLTGGLVNNSGTAALIEGRLFGVYLSNGLGTVVNGGTIIGASGGDAVAFMATGGLLVDEAGSTFIGKIAGDHSTLELAGSGGAISGLGSQYTGFSIYEILTGGAWTLSGTNSIASAVTLNASASLVTQGTLSDSGHTAIYSDLAGVSIGNAGTIIGTSQYGIDLHAGGSVTNSGPAAAITGKTDSIRVQGGSGAVVNRGTINAQGDTGVALLLGGSLTNSGTAALIEGKLNGVVIAGGAGTVVNDGRIGGDIGTAVSLALGGIVINEGSAAFIKGATAIVIGGAGTVVNYGTISVVVAGTAIQFEAATDVLVDEAGSTLIGNVTGGGGTLELAGIGGTLSGLGSQFTGFGQYDVLAGASWTLSGANTVASAIDIAGTGTLVLTGTLVASGTAVYALNGGLFTDSGSVLSTGSGGIGVELSSAGGHPPTFINSGSVIATGSNGIGVDVLAGGRVTNQVGGYIAGTTGFLSVLGTTLTNFGTIASTAGAAGVAIQFDSAADVLVDEAGSVIVGQVLGGGGTMNLAGGNASSPGTISGLGSQFTGFANYALSGAWAFTGANDIGVAGNLRATGAVIDNGTLEIDGGAAFGGPISGSGTLLLDGIESVHGQSVISVANLVVGGGTLTTTAGFKDANSVTIAGGVVSLTGQSVTLSGTALVSGGTIVGGVFDTTGAANVTGGTFANRAVWQNSGTVTLNGGITFGDAAGSGQLVNTAGGVFDMTADAGISVQGLGGGVLNRGLFEKTGGTGQSLIQGSMNNTASILVSSGTLHFVGGIAGTGGETIGSAGVLRVNAAVASTQTISFVGSGGELSLSEGASSLSSFAAPISGFGQGDGILIGSLAYSTGPSVHWTQQGSKGTLTVTDNGVTLNLILFGQYAAAGFAVGNGGGASLVTYTPPPAQVALVAAHR